MALTHAALDMFVSHNLSKLNKCDAPDLAGSFAGRRSWVDSFVLISIFRAAIKDPIKPLVFSVLRRAEMIPVEYADGRTSLIDYISTGEKDRISIYFRALYHFELVVSLLYQIFEFVTKYIDVRFFDGNDGSPASRLNKIYNSVKHLNLKVIQPGTLNPIWITNEGLAVSEAELSWEELAALIEVAARIADFFSNPDSKWKSIQS